MRRASDAIHDNVKRCGMKRHDVTRRGDELKRDETDVNEVR